MEREALFTMVYSNLIRVRCPSGTTTAAQADAIAAEAAVLTDAGGRQLVKMREPPAPAPAPTPPA